MLFSSIPFLFYFLPIVILLYFAVPKKLKNLVLLLSSLFFYGWGEPRFLVFMLVSILQGYIFGLLIEKHQGTKRSKVFLAASVIFSLGLLGYCKYADFFITNFNALTGMSVPLLGIALPIGISFYTFQILSYTVDVYRKDVAAQRNLINLAAYIAMFPQLIAGPIVRYSDIALQLEERSHSFEKCAEGIRRFVLGLAKKILIANILGELVATFKASDDKSVLFYWMYAFAYLFHIYFDFSGYSDMAIGLGKIFGFDFIENFNYPYISGSITEFWRRWHISLGSWFRDYLYIPMGGNRVSTPRHLFNILVVWMATGFWHGAAWNFILWGLMFAVLLIIEKLFLLKVLKKLKVLNHIYVMFFVILSFVLFDSLSIADAFHNIGAMLGAGGIPLISTEAVYYLKSYAVILVIGAVGSTPLPAYLVNKAKTLKAGTIVVNILEPVCLVGLLTVCTAFLIDGSFNPFLYFRF
ncbi:MAG: MBOAT family protein [Ruminococcus sp.]|nr:MBOAT family protein [Ruminococcus sp.]